MTRGRLILIALASLLVAALPARAGTIPDVEILGFSADGSVFAFEEYGIQDGSGFPFSNRFYIDTMTDGFLPGTPVRVRIDDETASLEQARAEARERGRSVISDAELSANRGTTAGWNAITELSADPHRIAVNPRTVIPPIDDPLEFRLEEIGLQQPQRCEGLGEVVGFRLVRVGVQPGQAASLIHEDSSIPTSRGCPLGYRVGGVQTLFPGAGAPVYALFIAIRSFGFEGPDYRWIAVTGRL